MRRLAIAALLGLSLLPTIDAASAAPRGGEGPAVTLVHDLRGHHHHRPHYAPPPPPPRHWRRHAPPRPAYPYAIPHHGYRR